MILHSISPFAEESWAQKWNWRVPGSSPATEVRQELKLDKLEYANYLKTLKFKVGDIIKTRLPYQPSGSFTHWKVDSIQEVHSLAEYDGRSNLPKVYTLKSLYGMFVPKSENEIEASEMSPEEWAKEARS